MRAAFIAVGATLLPVALGAQAVTGIVANVENLDRVVGAEVLLFTTDSVLHAAAFSGENGEFLVEATESGTYIIEIRRLGFKSQAATIILQSDRVIEVRVNLAPEATELEGITVYGQTAETPEQREFLSRRHLPWNFSFDMEAIERMHAANVNEIVMFGVPGGEMRCYTIWLDGRPSTTGTGTDLSYGTIPISWVYGIEVYRYFVDIPLKYRDLSIDPLGRCGAILIWSTVAPGAGLPYLWTFGLGASAKLERTVFDVAWRRSVPGRYVTAVRARVGEYDPHELLGDAKATEWGFETDNRPVYASAYIGRQGPAVLLPWKNLLYTRVAAGASFYGGQRGETMTNADTVVSVRETIDPYFGFGGEVALGVRWPPSGTVRPWLELRTGAEYLTRAGFRWMIPVVTVGVEIGRLTPERGAGSGERR
jgi:hypothetical protein